jgi:tetratricopeptide (TPR) repeat protein
MTPDWQVDSGLRTSVFVSATTADLGGCRRQVADILIEAGVFPIIQDYFGPDPREIGGLLLDKILAADAVICLIGHAFGTASSSAGDTILRSYTQLEYDLAVRYEKPIYIFVATEEYAQGHTISEDQLLRDNQEAHRKAILDGKRKYDKFSSQARLAELIRSLVRPILVHAGRRSIRWLHLPPRPACFVGRTDEMQQFNEAIDKSCPAVIVMLGMGGQGKTSLCAYSIRSRATLPFAGGLWVSAETGLTFSEFLDAALGEFLGNRFSKVDEPGLDERIRRLILILQTRPLMIAIDAIERWLLGWIEQRGIQGLADLSMRQGAYEGLDQFLEQVSALDNGSHVILTSRALPAALDHVNCAILPVFPDGDFQAGLRGLSPEESVVLLSKLGMIAPAEKLRELAASLVCHPLALTGFASVACKVGVQWESLIPTGGLDPSNSFDSLMRKVREHLPDSQRSERLLTLCAFLPEGATIEMLSWMMHAHFNSPTESVGSLLARALMLADWSLLLWDRQTSTARLHGLIANYFRGLLTDAEIIAIHNRAATWYQQCASRCERGNRATDQILAVRHFVKAKESRQAASVLLGPAHVEPPLFDWLLANGHLWECSELLAGIESVSSDVEAIHCIIARAHVLHLLELPQRALADVQRATTIILAQSGSRQFMLQSVLARCYGLQGLIHTETGKASDALPLLDKAVVIFQSFGCLAREARFDLGKTLANRGLARWSCGDWDLAECDYRKTLDLLDSLIVTDPAIPRVNTMIHEVHSRLAALHLDRGEWTEAERSLRTTVLALQRLNQQTQTRPNKNDLMALIYLGNAYLDGRQPEKTLDVLKDVILPLDELHRQGRLEFDAILAQARVNEARALLQLGRVSDAQKAADVAVRLYEVVIAHGASQFQGQLSNALFKRSEARIRSGERDEGRKDLRHASSLGMDWVAMWFSECNCQTVFIENALEILPFLRDGFDAEKRELLNVVKQCCDRNITTERQTDALHRERVILNEKWHVLMEAAKDTGFPWSDTPPPIENAGRIQQ